MKKIILSERTAKIVKNELLKESYGEKVALVKKFLDDNFMRGFVTKTDDRGLKKNIGIFIQLGANKLPTDTQMMVSDVFDITQDHFKNILGDKKERDGFLKQTIKDWFDKKITKNGSLSCYNF